MSTGRVVRAAELNTDRLARHCQLLGGAQAWVWSHVCQPATGRNAGDRTKAAVMGSAKILVLLSLAARTDMLRAAGMTVSAVSSAGDIAVMTGLSAARVRELLGRLSAGGWVEAIRDGQRLYYRLPAEARAYRPARRRQSGTRMS